MNGDVFDFGFTETPAPDYSGVYEGGFNPQASDQSFFQNALSRVRSFIPSATQVQESPVTSQIMQAIYEFGRGKVDVAREKAVGAFLMTSEGQRIQQEATRQTVSQYSARYMPLVLIGGALLFIMMFARR